MGKLDHYPNFPSKHVAARNVDVWLPPGYHEALRFISAISW